MWRLLETGEIIKKADGILVGQNPNGLWCSADVHGEAGTRVKDGMVVRRIMKDPPGLTDQIVADIAGKKE
jgi:hypothetical protein